MPRQVGRKLYLTAFWASAIFGGAVAVASLAVVLHDRMARGRATTCAQGLDAEAAARGKPAFDPSKPFASEAEEHPRAELERLRKAKRAKELRAKRAKALAASTRPAADGEGEWVDEGDAWRTAPTVDEMAAAGGAARDADAALLARCHIRTWRASDGVVESRYVATAWSINNLQSADEERWWFLLATFALLPPAFLGAGRRWLLWLTSNDSPTVAPPTPATPPPPAPETTSAEREE